MSETIFTQAVLQELRAKYPNVRSFVMRGHEPDLVNTYICKQCGADGIKHTVYTEAPAKGGGFMRVCSGCQHEDGPWIPADQSPYYGF